MKTEHLSTIAYITNCYAPLDQVSVGASARQFYHVKALAEAGFNVDVVTASVSTVSEKHMRIKSTNRRVKINTVSVPTIRKNDLITRFAYHVRFFLRSLKASLDIEKPRLVLASTPTILIALQGLIVARLKKAELLLDVRDLWAVPLASTHFARISFFITLNRLLEKFLYLSSDYIVCTTQSQAEEIQKMTDSQVPVTVVPNGLDPHLKVNSSELHPLISKIRKNYHCIGLFAGKHANYTALETLINAARELEKDNFALLLVGGGYTKEGLMRWVKEERISNVFFHPPVSKSEIGSFLRGADIFFINYSALSSWSQVLPAKLFDYMYYNHPIVAAVVPGEITKIISESNAGISVSPEQPHAIAHAVRQIIHKGVENFKARDYLLTHYDREKTAQKLVNACFQTLNGK